MAEDDNRAVSTPHIEWRQGDFALGVGSFLFGDIPEVGDIGGIGAFFEGRDPAGFAVVSQTCDIVSDPVKYATVAVCPLVDVDSKRIGEVARGHVPRLGFIENAPQGLVADIARPMAISKQLLSTWKRVKGFTDEAKARAFAQSLERVFGRFAFPNAFNNSIRPLDKKIKSKYGKPNSPLGKAVNSLVEIRVRPSASWDSVAVRVQFLLIFDADEKRLVDPLAIKEAFETELEKMQWQGGFGIEDPPVRIGSYDDFLARDYVESVPLDVNALSFAARYANNDEDG